MFVKRNGGNGGDFRFVGDHMPPKSVAERMNKQLHRRLLGWKVPFRFFPQCRDCSSIQGSILSKATGDLVRREANAKGGFVKRLLPKQLDLADAPTYNHGWKPRINHWTGGVVAAVAVVGTIDDEGYNGSGDESYNDLLERSRRRYKELFDDVEQTLSNWSQNIRNRIHRATNSRR